MTSRNLEPRPSDAAWNETERELLSAAREERMPAELAARMRDALGLPQAVLEQAPRAAAVDTASPRQLFVGKLPLWGVLSVVAIGALSYYALSRPTPQPSAADAAVLASSPVVPPPSATPMPVTTAAATELDAARSGNAVTPDQLRIEAELLESARKALGKGALTDARRWLARYDEEFTAGVLHPESEVLAIELKVRTGARTAAKSQANRFLTAHPEHPLRDRVRELTTSRR